MSLRTCSKDRLCGGGGGGGGDDVGNDVGPNVM
jgi:hypothetical protein